MTVWHPELGLRQFRQHSLRPGLTGPPSILCPYLNGMISIPSWVFLSTKVEGVHTPSQFCNSFFLVWQIFMVIEALADGGVRLGLPRDMAQRLAIQTVLGTAVLARDSGVHPAQLRVSATTFCVNTIRHMINIFNEKCSILGWSLFSRRKHNCRYSYSRKNRHPSSF